MKKVYKTVISASLGLVVMAFASLSSAADVVDQNASTNNATMALFSQTGLAQSFQQAASNISGAGIFLESGIGSTDTVTISLYTDLPNAGGTLLTSGSTSGTAGQWADVFWAPYAITADTTYFLVFSGNTTLGISGDVENGYGRGNVFANIGYSQFSDYDYTFRTYASTNVAPVPEPETYAMMLAGLGLLALARRRKQKAA